MKDFVLKEFTPCQSLINGSWRDSIRAHWWLSLLRRERKSAVPARWPFLPVVRKSVDSRVVRFLLWRDKCPVHFGKCAVCPFALIDLGRISRVANVFEADLLLKRELFSLPPAPLEACSCLLTGFRCVEP